MRRTLASHVMSESVVVVRESTAVVDVVRLFAAHKISGLPVVDDHSRLVGIVTEGDILRRQAGAGGFTSLSYLHDEGAAAPNALAGGSAAGDIMTRGVITAEPDTTVRELAALMVRNQVNRIPIVAGERLVGIVTRADALRVFSRPDSALRDEVVALIRDDLRVDMSGITVRVARRSVRITGTVPSAGDAALIAATVAEMDGVAAVDCEDLKPSSATAVGRSASIAQSRPKVGSRTAPRA